MSLPSFQNPRPFRLNNRNYRVWFDEEGVLAHIDGQRRKPGGRTAWVWIWPRGSRMPGGAARETATSKAVRAALAAEVPNPRNKPYMGVIRDWGVLERAADRVVVGTLVAGRIDGIDLITSPIVLLEMKGPEEGFLETEHSVYRLQGAEKTS